MPQDRKVVIITITFTQPQADPGFLREEHKSSNSYQPQISIFEVI